MAIPSGVIVLELRDLWLTQPDRFPLEMPKLITLSRDGLGHFFISFSVRQTIKSRPGTEISVDLDFGLIDLAVLKNGGQSPPLKGPQMNKR